MGDVTSLDAFLNKKKELEENIKSAYVIQSIEEYERVVMKTVENFSTYSIQEKHSLYTALAGFNIALLRIMHDCEEEDE